VDAILGLVESIYEAGAHPENWHAALTTLADVTGSLDATMGGQTAAQVSLLVTARTDPELVRVYAERYHRHNPMQLAVLSTPVGRPVVDAMVMDTENFRTTEFYNEWCVPQRYFSGAALNLATSGGWRASLMISGDRQYDGSVLRILDTVAPHLIRAFQLNQVLHEAQSLGLSVFAALEFLDRGVLVAGVGGAVRTANGMAERILSEGDGLLLRDGQIVCSSASETRLLEQMIGRCAAGLTNPDEGRMQVSRSEGRSPLWLQCLSFPSSAWWPGFTPPRAMVFIVDPDMRKEQVIQRLRQRYGLTPAEASLAWEIVRSGGRKSAAEHRGISVATARSQLTSIFDKTGVRRQAELVRLLLDERADISVSE
jgi:DNA-binding CsgD family transcriptional regulator